MRFASNKILFRRERSEKDFSPHTALPPSPSPSPNRNSMIFKRKGKCEAENEEKWNQFDKIPSEFLLTTNHCTRWNSKPETLSSCSLPIESAWTNIFSTSTREAGLGVELGLLSLSLCSVVFGKYKKRSRKSNCRMRNRNYTFIACLQFPANWFKITAAVQNLISFPSIRLQIAEQQGLWVSDVYGVVEVIAWGVLKFLRFSLEVAFDVFRFPLRRRLIGF